MPGTNTHNYDLAIEIAEQAYQNLLGAIFDADGFLCNIIDSTINQIPGVNVPCGIFTVDVFFDKPPDVVLPPGSSDTMDIRINLGQGGSFGRLRMVVGMDVDHVNNSLGTFDVLRLDFANRLYFTSVDIGGIGDPLHLFETFMRNTVKSLPLLPFPVDGTTTDPLRIRAADGRLMDDTSPADLDATAALVTFGGGAAGNPAAFTQSFVAPGTNGAIAIFFDWICRLIDPALEGALQVPAGTFQDCRLTHRVRINDAKKVDLTKLEMTPVGNTLQVTAQVQKKGTCYTATGTVKATITLGIQNGNLVATADVADPDIDLDIPWYCYVAAAVLGALLGDVLGGAIGTLVGVVMAPLLLWLAQDVLEGLVGNIADRVVQAINGLSPDINVPAVGINLLFENVFIDDVVIRCRVSPRDRAPVRASGAITVGDGQYVDLDSGKVGDDSLPGADLRVDGHMFARSLDTLCNAALARTGSRYFDEVSRYSLYGYTYSSPQTVLLNELAQLDPTGALSGDMYRETMAVLAVRTNEERYGAIQAEKVDNANLRLRFVTYEKFLPSLEIRGEFRCEQPSAPPAGANVIFQPNDPGLAAPPGGQPAAATPAAASRIGRWVVQFPAPGVNRGRFDAVAGGLRWPVTFAWQVNGQPLSGESGTVSAGGQSVAYEINGAHIILQPPADQACEFELAASATDATGFTLSAVRCLHYSPQCPVQTRYLPPFAVYQAAYAQTFGLVERVLPAPPAIQ